ncbi:MAG: hypothetical protein L6R36_008855 [Xanthoria steineri]|nr:MAG: hypothetical protein L6R36_008855 [Xanthoria steineri]
MADVVGITSGLLALTVAAYKTSKALHEAISSFRKMHEMLDAYTIHGTDGRQSVRDWLGMRYHEKSFEDLK